MVSIVPLIPYNSHSGKKEKNIRKGKTIYEREIAIKAILLCFYFLCLRGWVTYTIGIWRELIFQFPGHDVWNSYVDNDDGA